MSESLRTIVYVAAGLAALVAAWAVKPARISYEKLDDSGQRFFEQFDPLAAKSLEISAINPDTLARQNFRVAQQSPDGPWTIPSRENYPADAQDHLAKAATSIMDVTKGTVVSDSPSDHELYGVADPNNTATLGAGMRVTLQDGAGKTLVDLILGKAVRETAPAGAGPQNLRYVRVPGRDRVYTAAVNTEALTTKFEDWIERDLLQLDSWQIREIFIDDYSIDELNQRVNRGDRMTFAHDQTNNTWNIVPADALKEGETLTSSKLEEMRSALDTLQIVDVHKKPAGLSSALQAEGSGQTLSIDSQALTSLASRGYYIVNGQLLSNEGETIIRTREGVEYSLRFGEIVNYDTGTAGGESPSGSTQEAGRFVFVTVNFNPAMIDQPQYQDVPENAFESDDPAIKAAYEDNETKRKDYMQKLADGQEKVRKLNSRFADWYYVVSDSVYQQIRLRRSDLVSGN